MELILEQNSFEGSKLVSSTLSTFGAQIENAQVSTRCSDRITVFYMGMVQRFEIGFVSIACEISSCLNSIGW